MTNLGHFDNTNLDLFYNRFSTPSDFSESTESFDFTTCQRKDGSFYGTSGQCRKGTQATKGASAEKPKSAKSKGGGGAPQTREQALAIRKAAMVKALKEAGLPTGPIEFKREVNKRLEGNAEHKAAQARAKELEPKLRAAKKAAREAQNRLEKDRFNPDLRAEWKRTGQEATKLNTEYERNMSTMRRIARREENALGLEQRRIANRAMLAAAAAEPKVNGQRLGDADWTTSPRD